MKERKIVRDKKNGKIYVVLSNGDMEEQGRYMGTIAVHLKSWVSENYPDFEELTENDLHGYVYFGREPKKKSDCRFHEFVDHWDAKTPELICSKCGETKKKL